MLYIYYSLFYLFIYSKIWAGFQKKTLFGKNNFSKEGTKK